ncbi:hypothetical protein BS47DRAFT_1484077 [Hydnum rufescens UP504]|uniref:Uncharacterized protein n=1 Tax=Hydnum rufescens UP504 TaxID=1448309 RepID=A0A9P6B260_9AGAM|nr:hypothetical protein BS47DRAFT_1484077 [Hydnum rufescens UP504]
MTMPTDEVKGPSEPDEFSITGESTPRGKREGSKLIAGTLNMFGFKCRSIAYPTGRRYAVGDRLASNSGHPCQCTTIGLCAPPQWEPMALKDIQSISAKDLEATYAHLPLGGDNPKWLEAEHPVTAMRGEEVIAVFGLTDTIWRESQETIESETPRRRGATVHIYRSLTCIWKLFSTIETRPRQEAPLVLIVDPPSAADVVILDPSNMAGDSVGFSGATPRIEVNFARAFVYSVVALLAAGAFVLTSICKSWGVRVGVACYFLIAWTGLLKV